MRDLLIARDGAIADVIDHTPRAASFFIDPTGEVMGAVLQDEEGIAYAEIDLNRCVGPKQFHDVVGYHNRFDIFDLSIDRTRLAPASFFDDAQVVAAAEPQIRKDTIKTVEPAPTSRE
jgi:aliphatic nitrilase